MQKRNKIIFNGVEVLKDSLPEAIRDLVPDRSYCRVNMLGPSYTISSISWFIKDDERIPNTKLDKETLELIAPEFRPIWLCSNSIGGIHISLDLGDTVVTDVGTFTADSILTESVDIPNIKEVADYTEKLLYANKPKLQQLEDDLYILYNYKDHVLLTKEELLTRDSSVIKDYGLYYVIKDRDNFYINKNDYGLLAAQLETGEYCDFEFKDYDTLQVYTETDIQDIFIGDLYTDRVAGINPKFIKYMKEYVQSYYMKYPKRNIRINGIIYSIQGNIVDRKYFKTYGMEDVPEDLQKMFDLQGNVAELQCKRTGGIAYLIGPKYITNCNTGKTYSEGLNNEKETDNADMPMCITY